MKLSKFLGLLLIVAMMFVFVGCGDKEQVETPVDIDWSTGAFYVEEGYGYDWQESGPYTVYEGDSFRVEFYANGNWGSNTKFELHENTLGVVDSDINGWVEYKVDTNFTDLNAGETKEYEFWATAAGFTSEKVKVTVKDREPLILAGDTLLGFSGEVKINEYVYDFNLISHDKNTVKFTKDTKIKQFTRLKGEETFVEKTITGIYPSKESGGSSYANGNVTVSFEIPKENVNKDIELYYEYEGLKSNVITVKTLNYYLDVKVTDIYDHEITKDNPMVVYNNTTESLKFDVSLFGPDGEIEDFEYTFFDMLGNPDVKNESSFTYELPKLNEEFKDFYNSMWQWDDDGDYVECRLSPYFEYTIETDECSGELMYYIDCGDNVTAGNRGIKDAPVYYWDIPSTESAKTLFIGDDGVWQKTDFSTTLTLTADGSLNYGTFVNDCLDDNYDFNGTYIINPLEYTAKAIIELDGEEKTFEIELFETDYDSNKGRRIYDTAFSMDLSLLGLSESEIFIKKTTTTPSINGEYSLYSDNSFSFTIDKNTMSYRFRQSDETKSLGTFTIEGNQITLDPLGDRPEFVGKKAIFSENGVALQYYDYSLEEDATVYLPKSSDANLELWISDNNVECGFDWESNTALLNDHEISIKNKTDDGFDLDYSGETVPCSKIEDDVYKFDPTSMGGVISYFVKAQFEDFDFNGTWVSSDGATLIIDDSKETEQLILTVGEYKISSTYLKHSGNIYSSGTDKTNFLSEGVVSASGTLYISYQGEDFDTTHELSSLILTKQQ